MLTEIPVLMGSSPVWGGKSGISHSHLGVGSSEHSLALPWKTEIIPFFLLLLPQLETSGHSLGRHKCSWDFFLFYSWRLKGLFWRLREGRKIFIYWFIWPFHYFFHSFIIYFFAPGFLAPNSCKICLHGKFIPLMEISSPKCSLPSQRVFSYRKKIRIIMNLFFFFFFSPPKIQLEVLEKPIQATRKLQERGQRGNFHS